MADVLIFTDATLCMGHRFFSRKHLPPLPASDLGPRIDLDVA
jgi:hypothetical protein